MKMTLKPYDVLSNLIPGLVVYAGLLKLFPEWDLSFEALPILGIAFVIGYFINVLSSLFESMYFFLWRAKPSRSLLLGKTFSKIQLAEWEQINNFLQADFEGTLPNDENQKLDALFNVAMRKVSNSKNARIADFNGHYALARSILTCILFLAIIGMVKFYNNWLYILIALSLIHI